MWKGLSCLAMLVVLGHGASETALALDHAQTTGGGDLKGELEAALKARLPDEFAFVARVVERVDQGQLPLEVVKSTMVWAIRKRPHAPFVYFERALRLRAAELGVSL